MKVEISQASCAVFQTDCYKRLKHSVKHVITYLQIKKRHREATVFFPN